MPEYIVQSIIFATKEFFFRDTLSLFRTAKNTWNNKIPSSIKTLLLWCSISVIGFALIIFTLLLLVIQTQIFSPLMYSPLIPTHFQLTQPQTKEILVDNIPVQHFQKLRNLQLFKRGKRYLKMFQKNRIVHLANAPNACTKKFVKIPFPEEYRAHSFKWWGVKVRSSEGSLNWLLLVDDTSCELKRKVMNAHYEGYLGLIVYTSPGSPLNRQEFLEQYWRENFNYDFRFDVYFVSYLDGVLIRDGFSYPKHRETSLELIPEKAESFEGGFLGEIRKWWNSNKWEIIEKVRSWTVFILVVVVGGFGFIIKDKADRRQQRIQVLDNFTRRFEEVRRQGNQRNNLRLLQPFPAQESLSSRFEEARLRNRENGLQAGSPAARVYNNIVSAVIQSAQNSSSNNTDPGSFFRRQNPNRLPKRHLLVIRSEFEETYLDFYKLEQGTDMTKELSVEFLDEHAIDYGGPTKEYLCMLRTALTNGVQEGKTIFTGLPNHRILVWDQELLEKGYYFAAGRAVCDISYGLKYAFAGLSLSVLEQITRGEDDETKAVTCHRDDLLCDEGVLFAYDILTKLDKNLEVSDQDIEESTLTLKEYGLCHSADILKEPKMPQYTRDLLSTSFLVERRLPAMKQFKEGLKDGGLLEYFKSYPPSALPTVFPRVEDTEVPWEFLKCKVMYVPGEYPSPNITENVHKYMDEIKYDQTKIKHLLSQWTGSEDLPIQMLRVRPSTDFELVFSSCDSTLHLCPNLDYDIFKSLVEENAGFNRL